MADSTNRRSIRKRNLHDPEPNDYAHLTPEERLAMVWPLTVQTWAWQGIDVTQQEPQRHVVRLLRRTR